MASKSQGDVTAWFKQRIEAIEGGTSDAVKDAAKRGEQITKHHIETRGTSKRGRVETGLMRDSVSSAVLIDNPSRTVTSFGWLQTREDYFKYQESGFTHNRSGAYIEGMYALVDAAEEVVEDLREDIERSVRNA